MDRLRAEADELLIGAGTMRADNPALHVRTDEMRDYRRSLGKPAALTRVLVTTGGRVDPASRFFDDSNGGADCIIATVDELPEARLAELAGRAEVWQLGRKRVDLPALLERLHARGIARLLLEGGGELNWAFLRENLIDELHVTIAPVLLGGREAPTLLEGEGLAMRARRKLRLEELHREGDELYCRYSVER
jgi:riboflavin-specific deaminase-like protein